MKAGALALVPWALLVGVIALIVALHPPVPFAFTWGFCVARFLRGWEAWRRDVARGPG